MFMCRMCALSVRNKEVRHEKQRQRQRQRHQPIISASVAMGFTVASYDTGAAACNSIFDVREIETRDLCNPQCDGKDANRRLSGADDTVTSSTVTTAIEDGAAPPRAQSKEAIAPLNNGVRWILPDIVPELLGKRTVRRRVSAHKNLAFLFLARRSNQIVYQLSHPQSHLLTHTRHTRHNLALSYCFNFIANKPVHHVYPGGRLCQSR